MRKLLITLSLLLSMGSMQCFAELGQKTDAKEIRKERIEIQKMKTKDLNKEVSKLVDKEALRLTSAGWRSKGGDGALKSDIENAYTVQFDYDSDLFPRFIVAEGTAMGRDYDLARERAISQAQNNLADAVQRELKTMLEFAETEKKIKPKDTKVMRASLVTIMKDLSESIQEAQVLFELSGAQGNNNEIFVKVAAPGNNLVEKARELVRVNLRSKGETYLADRVSIVFNWREATKADKVK